MLFRQLADAASSTYTYLLADEISRKAVIIDPVFEQHARDAALIRELGLELVATLDTHCHADHVSGAWLMKRVTGSRIGLSPAYGAKNVDLPLAHGDVIPFGNEKLHVRVTPGHTDGCLSFVTDNKGMVFTGDALLIRGAGRTDFQNGCASKLFDSIQSQIFTLPDECQIYPGHDYDGRTQSSVGEERQHNPRIGGNARREDFVGYMTNMALPHPKQIAVAVPANLRGGEPEDGAAPVVAPSWGPVIVTYAGVWEISPEWVEFHRKEIDLLDVRSAVEFDGELGHIDGARLLPLEELRARAAEITDERPVVVVCQTGKRSAMATTILRKQGLTRVANLAGGMVRWRELGL
jgi:glyoxylase-like metal-dependent hydrolase (beta-lactamase superfamily II)/rhodanese-related sulfurtransferase